MYTDTGYEFSTGINTPRDACGDLNSLPEELQCGPHFSSLMVNFRSNRRNTGMDFFLAVTCTLPRPGSTINGQNSNDSSTASVVPFSAAWLGRSQEQPRCIQTRNLSGGVVGTDPSRIVSARQYLVSYAIIIACLLALIRHSIIYIVCFDQLYNYTSSRGSPRL